MKQFLKLWPIIWLFIPLSLMMIFSGPFFAWLDNYLVSLTGEQSMIPLSTLALLAMGLFAWMSSFDLSFGAIRFNFKWLFDYYKDDLKCKEDFDSMSPSQRLWFLLAVLALFMLTFAIVIAQL